MWPSTLLSAQNLVSEDLSYTHAISSNIGIRIALKVHRIVARGLSENYYTAELYGLKSIYLNEGS